MTSPIDGVLEALPRARQSGDGWTAPCPAHDDKSPSLSVTEGTDGRVLLKCHAGCTLESIVEALGLTVARLFPEGEGEMRPPPPTTATAPLTGLTLAAYAGAKRLPLSFLRELGLDEIYVFSRQAVKIPYRDEAGSEVAARFRLALEGDARFRWRKGSKPLPYGLWRLTEARTAGRITLVEGESDAQTLWSQGEPALGVPGASTWKTEWASYLEGIASVYLVVEPDAGGDALLDRVGRSGIGDRLRLVHLEDVKDPSELYLSAGERFPDVWQKVLSDARPWTDPMEAERTDRAQAAREQAGDLVIEPDILGRFAHVLASGGYVAGEEGAVKLLYLAVTSRLLDEPVSVVMKGPSAAGKSYLVKRVLEFFPPRAQFAVTAMSERALAYDDEPLSHRMLVIYEAAGLASEFATYLVRSLLSEGRLHYVTVEKTADGLRPRHIIREGPTGLILTTTEARLHAENETRVLSIPVTDTPAQTKAVLRSLATRQPSPPDVGAWHAFQDWLEAAEHRVTMPYVRELIELIPPVAVRLRRDVSKLLRLVETQALLQQASRARDEAGAVVATVEDYRVVHGLVADLLSEGIEATVPQTVREVVSAVQELGGERPTNRDRGDELGVTAVAIGRLLDLDKSAARRRALDAIERGHLENLETRRGRAGRYVLAEPLPEEVDILPKPEVLEAQARGAVARELEGVEASPSHDDAADGDALVALAKSVFGEDVEGTDIP